MILVDTSVWIDHLRHGNRRLEMLLQDEMVFCHPFILGELACGNLNNREEILRLMSSLPRARLAEHSESLYFLETHRLYGCGLGWVDLHLLSSASLTGCKLWTMDKPLLGAALTSGVSA